MNIKAGGTPMKRPAASPAPPRTNFKRLKTLGGFIDDDSDEDSDTERGFGHGNDYHGREDRSENEDDEGNPDSNPTTPPPPRQLLLDERKVAQSSSLPSNPPVNVALLRKLLGKKQRDSITDRTSSLKTVKRQLTTPTATPSKQTQCSLRNSRGSKPEAWKATKKNVLSARKGPENHVISGRVSSQPHAAHSKLDSNTLNRLITNPENPANLVYGASRRSGGGVVSTPGVSAMLAPKAALRQLPLNKSSNVAIGAVASLNTHATNTSTPGTTANICQKNSPQMVGSAGLVSGLIQGIRGGRERNAVVKNTPNAAVPTVSKAQHNGKMQEKSRTVTPHPDHQPLQITEPEHLLGPCRKKPISAHQSPAKSMNKTTEPTPSDDRRVQPPSQRSQSDSRASAIPNEPASTVVSNASFSNGAHIKQRRKAEAISRGLDDLQVKKSVPVPTSPSSATEINEREHGRLQICERVNVPSGSTRPTTAASLQKLSIVVHPASNPKPSSQNSIALAPLEEATPFISTTFNHTAHRQSRLQAQGASVKPTAIEATAREFTAEKLYPLDLKKSLSHSSPYYELSPNIPQETAVSVNIPTGRLSAITTDVPKATTAPLHTDLPSQKVISHKSLVESKKELVAPSSIGLPSKEESNARESLIQDTGKQNLAPKLANEVELDERPMKNTFAGGNGSEISVKSYLLDSALPIASGAIRAIRPISSSVISPSPTLFTPENSLSSTILSQQSESAPKKLVEVARAEANTSTHQPLRKGKESSINVSKEVTPDPRPYDLSEFVPGRPQLAPLISQRTISALKGPLQYLKTVSGPSKTTAIAKEQPPISIAKDAPSVIVLTTSPKPAADDEPYFEFSIHQALWSDSELNPSVTSSEPISRYFTCIDEVNAHAEQFFRKVRDQYQQHFQVKFSEWKGEKNEHGCNVLTGTFTPIDDPRKKSYVKFWVKRDYVSAYAGVKPQAMPRTSFVTKTVYILRLFELFDPASESDAEDVTTSKGEAAKRIYHPLPRTECYTTLDAANRAARDVQIELSLEQNPTEMNRIWQEKTLKELHDKFRDMGEEKCWKSKFNGLGLGSNKFELVVEKVVL